MPSSLIVQVTTIEKINAHPNADALELAHILGWQVVVRKGEYHEGQHIVYFPPDTVLPTNVSDRFGVTKYLSNGRIRCTKLRGEPSFGLVVVPDDPAWEVGANVAEHYGATKYEPPLRLNAGDIETPHPLFLEYTNIENLRNFPDVFRYDEEVVVTEKIHGTSCRVGLIEGERMAGSNRQRRKVPDGEEYSRNTYWYPWGLESVEKLMHGLGHEYNQVILFGEIYGTGIQSFTYGMENAIGFRAFDLMVDGKYLDSEAFAIIMDSSGVPRVPVLHSGLFDIEKIKNLSEGNTTLVDGANIREGVVVRPRFERQDPKVGRVCLKYISDSYLFGDASDFTEQ